MARRRSTRRARRRAFDILLIALAGPAASAIGLIVSLELLRSSAATGTVHNLLWAATLDGVFAVFNLIPLAFEEQRGGPSLKTDGRLALNAAQSMRLQH
jgi:Zn-dependent protease